MPADRPFEELTLSDARVKAALAEQIRADAYRVTLDVVAKQVPADSTGTETEVRMSELVHIGVVAGDERPYFERHRIRSGEQRVTVTLSLKPDGVGVDPYDRLIQRVNEGKVVGLEEQVRRPGDSAAWTAEYRARTHDSTESEDSTAEF